MTKQPSGGADLTMQIAAQRRRMKNGGVRVTQAGGYVAVKRRSPHSRADCPTGAAFEDLFLAGRRGSSAMARDACRKTGRRITSQAKMNDAVVKELRNLGLERLWKDAKIKSGRPPIRRG